MNFPRKVREIVKFFVKFAEDNVKGRGFENLFTSGGCNNSQLKDTDGKGKGEKRGNRRHL